MTENLPTGVLGYQAQSALFRYAKIACQREADRSTTHTILPRPEGPHCGRHTCCEARITDLSVPYVSTRPEPL